MTSRKPGTDPSSTLTSWILQHALYSVEGYNLEMALNEGHARLLRCVSTDILVPWPHIAARHDGYLPDAWPLFLLAAFKRAWLEESSRDDEMYSSRDEKSARHKLCLHAVQPSICNQP